jgi:putative nucleotidyltransferase with HDIG domain
VESKPSPRPLRWPAEVERLRELLTEGSAPVSATAERAVYLVGGTVRDALLGRPSHDIDLVTPGDGLRMARRVADALGGAFYPLDAARGVGRVLFVRPQPQGERLLIDIARFRGASLEADLRGRDFTVNAMAVDLAGSLQAVLDPLGGLEDLQSRRLRLCAPSAIADDPARALRAVRQSMALGLRIDRETRAAIRRDGCCLAACSAERVREEFIAILEGPKPAGALRALDALGVLEAVVPEVAAMRGLEQPSPHAFTLWEHTLHVVDSLDRVLAVIEPDRTDSTAAAVGLGMIAPQLDRFRADLQAHLAQTWPDDRQTRGLLMLSALLHDVGKPQTQAIDENGQVRFFGHALVSAELAETRARALRLSRSEVQRVATIVRYHMRPMMLTREPKVTRRAIYRFFRDTDGEAGVDVCLLALADHLGTAGVALDAEEWGRYVGVAATLLEAYFRKRSQVVEPPALLTGKDIISALGIPQGPQIGRLLEALWEAQASGEVSTRDEALSFVEVQARQHP